MQMQSSRVLSMSPSSPSFNTYSSGRLAEIAARVVEEFRQESGHFPDDDEIYPTTQQQQQQAIIIEEEEEEEEEEEDSDDFEFPFVCREPETSPITADEIFYNGQIRPIYPLFDTSLLVNDDAGSDDSKPPRTTRRSPLGKLMREDRETTSSSSTASCSSSEADELEGLTPGSYCVWKPKGGSSSSEGDRQSPPGRCKKSNSTGTTSSKRWKLRDLLYRSHSDGKDKFAFLAPSKRDKTGNSDRHHHHHVNEAAMEVAGRKLKEADYHQDFKAVEKRRSYLPYRQDLVGIFSNVNGLNRNLRPF